MVRALFLSCSIWLKRKTLYLCQKEYQNIRGMKKIFSFVLFLALAVGVKAQSSEELMKQSVRYLIGDGVPQSEAEFQKLYAKAVEAGTQVIEGPDYVKLQQMENPEQQVVNLLTSYADKENINAMYQLGVFYRQGRGVEKSIPQAQKWFTKAANLGHANSQYQLGNMYSFSEIKSATPDADALKWWRKAAAQGHADALFSVGVCYLNGDGVKASKTEAIKWLKKAAAKGHEDAKEELKGLGQ